MTISGEEQDPEREWEKRKWGIKKEVSQKKKKGDQPWEMSGKMKAEYIC